MLTIMPGLGVYFVLKGTMYTNNSAVEMINIGKGEDALMCKTNKEDCCATTKIGKFFYPNGVEVPIKKRNMEFYRNRGDQVVRLNRRGVSPGTKGMYYCEVPDACNAEVQRIYIELI